MRWIVNERIERWDCHQKREVLGRLEVRIYVAKEGTGRNSFTIEVAPPWPQGTEQWAGLFDGTEPVQGFE